MYVNGGMVAQYLKTAAFQVYFNNNYIPRYQKLTKLRHQKSRKKKIHIIFMKFQVNCNYFVVIAVHCV